MEIVTFQIPEDLAKNLSDLLAEQVINDRILASVADQPAKYQALMAAQIRIQKDIDFIKYQITTNYVPEQYRSNEYNWNYDGYQVAGTNVQILKA